MNLLFSLTFSVSDCRQFRESTQNSQVSQLLQSFSYCKFQRAMGYFYCELGANKLLLLTELCTCLLSRSFWRRLLSRNNDQVPSLKFHHQPYLIEQNTFERRSFSRVNLKSPSLSLFQSSDSIEFRG